MGTRIKPEIFGIRTLDIPIDVQAGNYSWGIGWPKNEGPTELLQGQADFRATGAVLATLLMMLIVIYGLVATVGSWVVLKRRNLVQHSWLAFAGGGDHRQRGGCPCWCRAPGASGRMSSSNR